MFAATQQTLALRKTTSTTTTSRSSSLQVHMRAVKTGVKKSDLKDGKFVYEDDAKGRILLQEFMGDVYAINNKCPHLGLPLQGKTPLLSATCSKRGGVVCPVHGSEFDLKTGEALGEWCPKVPTLPFVGKPMAGEPKNAEVYPVAIDESTGEIVLEL